MRPRPRTLVIEMAEGMIVCPRMFVADSEDGGEVRFEEAIRQANEKFGSTGRVVVANCFTPVSETSE